MTLEQIKAELEKEIAETRYFMESNAYQRAISLLEKYSPWAEFTGEMPPDADSDGGHYMYLVRLESGDIYTANIINGMWHEVHTRLFINRNIISHYQRIERVKP